ncbi:hypothetical protein GE09DRAFT_575937 [Coniochaeta sp. 2T2.1]|nr:hypothetical protein GE09DRAFT_575937 [Coniochaeta sp. 2T2.1]
MADTLVSTVTKEMLTASQKIHNGFPSDTAFPDAKIPSHGFEALCAVIAKHGVEQSVRLRRLHQHFTIPDGHIQLGKSIPHSRAFWTRPTPIDEVDLKNIHAYVLSLDNCLPDTGQYAPLIPSEFREGPPGNVRNISTDFVKEFVDCLRTNGLENMFGLELREAPDRTMIEFSFHTASLLLGDEDVRAEVRQQAVLQVTGWAVAVKDGNVLSTGEKRCAVLADGVHRPLTNTKFNDASDALKYLQEKGYISKMN